MDVFAVQSDIAWQNPEANYQNVRQLIRGTTIPRGSVILLPEMFATGFSMNPEKAAEPVNGPTFRFLSELAAETACHVIGGLATDVPCNEAFVVSPGGDLAHRYAKRHLFSMADEHQHYQAGTELDVFPLNRWTCSLHICYDLRFPEDFRTVAENGAELFIVIANWPAVRSDHWTSLLKARAIENQAYVVGVNRCGSDPTQEYAGGTCFIDPRGRVISDLGTEQAARGQALDHPTLSAYRKEFPVLKDMIR